MDLLFPPLCCNCGRLLVRGEHSLCSFCQLELPRCRFSSLSDNPVGMLFWGRVYVYYAGALCYFSQQGVVQNLVHQIKYREGVRLAGDLGQFMGEELKNNSWINEIDGITNVPLHPKREKERGYNQSALLAYGVANSLGKPFYKDIVARENYTMSQTSLEGLDRWENVMNAFRLRAFDSLRGKHLLLIDDVITTGATIEACVSQLLKIPDVKVSVFAFSFAGS